MQATFPDLIDSSVFITGGGSGIGAALTEAFLRQGARVAFVDRIDATDFADLMARATGNRPLFIRADVTDTPALEAAIAQAASAHGPITTLIGNAANDMRRDAMDVTEAFWDEQHSINLKHYFFAAKAVQPGMKAAGGGSIIFYTSTSYMIASDGMPAYVANKAGIMGLTRALARDWGPFGIRVNGVAPGWVLTEKQLEKWATPDSIEAFRARQCLKTMMKPDDMAGVTLFLASQLSALMSAQVVTVDAGLAFTG